MSKTWGSIAIGCRIAKHPEAAFFASWTGLIVQGMRDNDMVLAPSAHMPAHWASDYLVKQFLKSDHDSLLMIDDDMQFEPDALERLRSHEANYDYDIVFAFCTTRELPPRPVMLKLSPETDKNGHELFDRVMRFHDGQVVPVDTVGLAFTLIRRHVFEAMSDQEYLFTYGYGRETDEATFCRRARQLGFTMAVDTSVKIDHIASIPIGWDHLVKSVKHA